MLLVTIVKINKFSEQTMMFFKVYKCSTFPLLSFILKPWIVSSKTTCTMHCQSIALYHQHIWWSLFRPNISVLIAVLEASVPWMMFHTFSLLVFVSLLVLVVHVWREFALNSASTHWLSFLWTVFRHHHLPESHVPTSTRSQSSSEETPTRVTIVSSLFWYTEGASCLRFSWLHGPKSKQCSSCWTSCINQASNQSFERFRSRVICTAACRLDTPPASTLLYV